jgi:peptide/nickel transport system permease protein
MLKLTLRRLPLIFLTVLGTAILNFFLLKAVPGDLVDVIAVQSGSATPEYMAQLRAAYGLDASLPMQLLHYLGQLAQLDLGHSFRYNEAVLQLILDRLPATLALVGAGLLLALVLGVLIGVASAVRPHGVLDSLLSSVSTLGYSAPMFWTALMLIVLFGVKLDWLPVSGIQDLAAGASGWALFGDRLLHLILPASTLAMFYLAMFARLSRASMIETLQQDYIRTARAKGNRSGRVVWRHALRNAFLPVLTMLGLQSSALLGGSIVVESVFAWPGLGQLSFDAITNRDLNLLLGILLFSALLVVLANLLVDLLYGVLDPRVRAAE